MGKSQCDKVQTTGPSSGICDLLLIRHCQISWCLLIVKNVFLVCVCYFYGEINILSLIYLLCFLILWKPNL